MRKYLIAFTALLLLFSCREKFSYDIDLALSGSLVEMPAEGGWHTVGIYTEDAWTAELSGDGSWLSMDRTSGTGRGGIHIECGANGGMRRGVLLLVHGSGRTDTLTVVQAAGAESPTLAFETTVISTPYSALPVNVGINSSLGDISAATVKAVDPFGNPAEWIKNISVDGGSVSFETEGTAAARTATITLTLSDFDGQTTLTSSLTVNQTADAPYFRAASSPVMLPFTAGKAFIPVATNIAWSLTPMLEKATCSENWASVAASDWVPSKGQLVLTLTENPASTVREAKFSLPFSDISGNSFPLTIKFTQKGKPQEYSFAQLKALATTEGYTFTGDGMLRAVSISDGGHPNMDNNPQTGQFSFDYSVNPRTGYIQNSDGTSGFKLRFDTPEDNRLVRGAGVIITLEGATITKESNPDRYTISGLSSASVGNITEGTGLTAKRKTITELTDSDIYTYVTLTGVEFPCKDQAYTSGNDNFMRQLALPAYPDKAGAAINAKGKNDVTQFDMIPGNIIGSDGSALMMLTNNETPWRRYGTTVAQGICDVSGIIVHSVEPRWGRGGDIGRYSIRIMEEEDIVETASGAQRLVEWNWPKGNTVNTSATVLYPTWPEGSNAEFTCSVPESNPATYTDYDGPSNASFSVTAGALCWKSAKGKAFWGTGDDADAAPYVQLKFSASGASGSLFYMFWTVTTGSGSTTESYHIPSLWKVQYSTDGVNFTTLPKEYIVHPRVWSTVTTPSFGVSAFSQFVTALPASLLGQANVYVRIRATEKTAVTDDLSSETGGEVKGVSGAQQNFAFGQIGFRYR